MALTDKQRRFVDAYLTMENPETKTAALIAGYSSKTAHHYGYTLLKQPEIAAAIREAQAERSERTKVDADWLLTRLASEAEADVSDLYDEHGALRPVKDWPAIWRKGLVAGLDVEEIKSEGCVIGIIRKIKLSDRIKRLELIGKHIDVGAFSDKHELTGEGGGPLQVVVKQFKLDADS